MLEESSDDNRYDNDDQIVSKSSSHSTPKQYNEQDDCISYISVNVSNRCFFESQNELDLELQNFMTPIRSAKPETTLPASEQTKSGSTSKMRLLSNFFKGVRKQNTNSQSLNSYKDNLAGSRFSNGIN